MDRFEVRLPRWWRPLLSVGVLALAGPVLLLGPRGLPVGAGRTLAALLLLVQVVAVWWMGTRPRVVTAVVFGAAAGVELLFPAVGPGVALIVLCTFAWLMPARSSLWALGAAAGLAAVLASIHGDRVGVLLWLAAPLLAWSWGALGRASGARRWAEARRAVLEERARIARELHDVLAHTVSVMVVQAAAADDVFDSNPAQARQAVRAVEAQGREALAELRRFLGIVRSGSGQVPSPGQPQPGLGDLDRLARSMAGANLEVEVRCDGVEQARITPAVQLSAYRIVQEALTNTVRHARARRVEVSMRAADGYLVMDIRDDGRGGGWLPGRGAGYGIVGMQERAALVGGSLEAGPDPAGGFRVAARLPVSVQ